MVLYRKLKADALAAIVTAVTVALAAVFGAAALVIVDIGLAVLVVSLIALLHLTIYTIFKTA